MQHTLVAQRSSEHVAAWPWLMLFGRVALLAGWQALVALGFYLEGRAAPWQASIAWWPLTVALANLTAMALLVRLYRDEGGSYWDLFRPQRQHLRGDLLAMLGLLVITGPVSMAPNILLANALFGSPEAAVAIMLQPLPRWALYAGLVLFPLTQGLVELPTYFAYVMPRLKSQGLPGWLAVSLPAMLLGLQHIAVPLVFDARFIAWRGLMFLPFAFLAGLALYWRPRLLPYMVVVHIVMDLAFVVMLPGL